MTATFNTSLDPENPIITNEHYRTVRIPKFKLENGKEIIKGWRVLNIPCEQLMSMQRDLLAALQSYRGAFSSSAAHAFMPNRSIKTMAVGHVHKPVVIRIDIKDFFPSISPQMLRSAMLDAGYPNHLIKRALSICFYNNSLPQGAPTSPFLSNIVGRMIDARILALCKVWRSVSDAKNRFYRHRDKKGKVTRKRNDRLTTIHYTRYADDLVLSSSYKHLSQIINPIKFILKKCGFYVNREKILVSNRSNRQVICGITVNEKLSKPKPYRKRVRAMIHNMITDNGFNRCPKGHYIDRKSKVTKPINFDQLGGLVAHIRDVCPEQSLRVEELLAILKEIVRYPKEEWSYRTKDYLRRHPDVLFV